MVRLFIPLNFLVGATYIAPEITRKHIHVLRLAINTEVEVFNGDGASYLAQITQITRKELTITILKLLSDTTNNTSSIKITLAISMLATDKMDLIIQKATELNIYKITPVITLRTQQISNDRLLKRLEHWRNIGISSSEQCGRNLLPIIEEPINLDSYLDKNNNTPDDSLKLILSPYSTTDTQKIRDTLASLQKPLQNITLLIGPEGGFTEPEIQNSVNAKFTPWKLEYNILRAETAAIASIVTIQTLCVI